MGSSEDNTAENGGDKSGRLKLFKCRRRRVAMTVQSADRWSLYWNGQLRIQELEEISIPARSLERIVKGPWRIEWFDVVDYVQQSWGVVNDTKQN